MWNPAEPANHDPQTKPSGERLGAVERIDALIEDARHVLLVAIPSLDQAMTAEQETALAMVEGNIILLRETLSKLDKAKAALETLDDLIAAMPNLGDIDALPNRAA